jgi:hypothetical protein
MTCDVMEYSKANLLHIRENKQQENFPSANKCIEAWKQLVNNLLCNFDDDLLFLMR